MAALAPLWCPPFSQGLSLEGWTLRGHTHVQLPLLLTAARPGHTGCLRGRPRPWFRLELVHEPIGLQHPTPEAAAKLARVRIIAGTAISSPASSPGAPRHPPRPRTSSSASIASVCRITAMQLRLETRHAIASIHGRRRHLAGAPRPRPGARPAPRRGPDRLPRRLLIVRPLRQGAEVATGSHPPLVTVIRRRRALRG